MEERKMRGKIQAALQLTEFTNTCSSTDDVLRP
jgi:hypothetical protein